MTYSRYVTPPRSLPASPRTSPRRSMPISNSNRFWDYFRYAGPVAGYLGREAIRYGAKVAGRAAYNYLTTKRQKLSTGRYEPIRVRPAKNVAQLKRKVQKLERRSKEGETTLDYRTRSPVTWVKPVNQNFMDVTHFWGLSSVNDVMTRLQYYDEASQTFVTRSQTGTNDQKSIYVDYVETKCSIKNSYQVPLKIEIYVASTKTDTNTFPNTFYDQGVADIVIDPVTMLPSNQLIKLSDAKKLNRYYKITKKVTKVLMPGQSVVSSHKIKGFMYDPTTVNANVFQTQLKGHCWILRAVPSTQGIGHNTAGSAVGIISGQVDVIYDTHVIVKYDGGINARRLYVNDQSGAIGDSALTGVQYISDNQARTQL